MPTRQEIVVAATNLAPAIRRTPILELESEVFDSSGPIVLKLESLQHSGSFKARGALNALLTNRTQAVDAGVVAASGGNHGAAVAWAAQQVGARAHVFVPSIASAAKVARLEAYEAEVRVVGDVFADALIAAQQFEAETGALSVHAYDDPLVVTGAATVGLELAEQVPDVDQVFVACGGGGLAGGLASWFGSEVELVVVETTGTPTFAAAVANGEPATVEVTGLAADSLGASRLGSTGWSALQAANTTSVLVSDDDVTKAQQRLWDTCRILTEPAAAAAVAAATTQAVKFGARPAVIICGANTTIER